MVNLELWKQENTIGFTISETLTIPEHTVYRVVHKLKGNIGIECDEDRGRPRFWGTKNILFLRLILELPYPRGGDFSIYFPESTFNYQSNVLCQKGF